MLSVTIKSSFLPACTNTVHASKLPLIAAQWRGVQPEIFQEQNMMRRCSYYYTCQESFQLYFIILYNWPNYSRTKLYKHREQNYIAQNAYLLCLGVLCMHPEIVEDVYNRQNPCKQPYNSPKRKKKRTEPNIIISIASWRKISRNFAVWGTFNKIKLGI